MAVTTLTFAKMPLIYGTCGCLPCTTSQKKCKLVGAGATIPTISGGFTSHPYIPFVTTLAVAPIMTQADGTDDDVVPVLIVGHPSEIPSSPIEVTEATDLSSLKVKFILLSRTREQ